MFPEWNARSVKTKTTTLSDILLSHRLDIISIIETWLAGIDFLTLAKKLNTLQVYSINHLLRFTCWGDGVAVIARKGLAVTQKQTKVFSSFEHLDLNSVRIDIK